MANIKTTEPTPIKSAANNASVITSNFGKRSTVDLLPGVNKTETLTKFFNATVDHLFQPENIEFINGYIGAKPPYYDSSKDFYIPESDKIRTDYQLPVTAVSVDKSSNALTNVMFYDDILGQLQLQGANVSNPDRLFGSEYYSWLPPIDPDKFSNYYNYYWLPDGPFAIQLLGQTDLMRDVIGKETFTYNGEYTREYDDVTINGTLKFTSGLKIQVTNDATEELNGRFLIVEGVGRSITCKNDTLLKNPNWNTYIWSERGWDGGDPNLIPDYITIERYSKDLNRWSVNNRWFHYDVVTQSGMPIDEITVIKAKRPIIEFNANLQLFNNGWHGRPDIDLVDTVNTDVFSAIAGNATAEIDGTVLRDGMRILVTVDSNHAVNNKIYKVSGIEEYGIITLDLVTDGLDSTGFPVVGETVYVMYGRTHEDNTYWYDGNSWKLAQRAIKRQAPLFAGYDKDGINLIDPAVYPGSTFVGNTIFTYELDSTAVVDNEIGARIKRDQFGDYIFNNTLVTNNYSYVENGQSRQISGYVWYKISDIYGNGWHKCKSATKQYKVNSFEVTTDTSVFMIDQTPSPAGNEDLPSVRVHYIEDGAVSLLVKDKDYSINGRVITLREPAPQNSRIEIYSWSNAGSASNNGRYELPSNLVANANNSQPEIVPFNNTIKHFASLISNQSNEISSGIGLTNWRDSKQVKSLGTEILQHRSPLLKLMMLNSNNINTGMLSSTSITDPSLAIQFGQKEYTRFYNKFIRTLFNLYMKSSVDSTITPHKWIDSVLTQLNLGKSKVNAWAYSGYEQDEHFSTTSDKPTFIPPTAAKLGVSPVYKPQVFLDSDYYPAKLTIQTHDGARIIMEDLEGLSLGSISHNLTKTSNPALLTHPLAAAWLQLELNLYNAIPSAYRDPDAVPAFDIRVYKPGKWRNTEYSREEYLNVIRPSFDKWVIQSQVDHLANTTFSVNNQFSFNYSTCVDKEGNHLPGHWRGIYKWYYDTDRPHTHPWEMLGFSQQPVWWNDEYGDAPYTRGNTRLWEDLRDGVIQQGARAGKYSEWARPGLLNCIPVDDQGDLLTPILAGTIVGLPSLNDSQAEWRFGDNGPVEQVWYNSLDYSFINALGGYLLKPARFIEQGWDPLRTVKVGEHDNEQYLYLNTDYRRGSAEFYVHRENPVALGLESTIPNESTLNFFGSWGIQHWISEYLISQNLSVTTYLGKIIRGSYSVLAHKFGGFIGTGNNFRVMVDSFGQLGYSSQLIPSENIQTYIYRSASVGSYFYSAVIVEKVSDGWKIYGYNGVSPYFTIIPSIESGPKSNIIIGKQSITDYQTGSGTKVIHYGTILETRQDVYDFLISYGRWLENQGWIFDTVNPESGKVVNWRQSARDFVYWSQGNWSYGNFIALSPGANGVKFIKDFGSIQYVNGTISGTFPILDKIGQPIESQNVEVLRQDGEILIKPVNTQTIYAARLFVTTVEHVMLLDNVTQFNDLIYDPLYNIYQPRLKIYGYRTNGWTGRLDAPGYFLNQDPTTGQWKTISNFEKTTEDFRRIYNIEQPKNFLKVDHDTGDINDLTSTNYAVTDSTLSDLGKHLIGYQKRNYLQSLSLDDTTEFEFYQGFIKQKGTKKVLNGMLRNTSILESGEKINYYEEYALRTARYGATSLNSNIDFIISQKDVVNNPQRIDVFSNYKSNQSRDGAIELTPRDQNIVVPPENYEDKLFQLRSTIDSDFYEDLPTVGYVELGETTHYVADYDALIALDETLTSAGKELTYGDTIWQFFTNDFSWTTWKVVQPNAKIIDSRPDEIAGKAVIVFDGIHGIVTGDIVVIRKFPSNLSMNGTFTVNVVTSSSITIDAATTQSGAVGEILIYRQIRFYSKQDLLCSNMLGGWSDGELAYVDNGETTGQWTVYKHHSNGWQPYRTSKPKVDAKLILQSKLYDKNNFELKTTLEYFDPAKGIIPGIADKEISYRSIYDPAHYNKGDSESYSINQNSAWAQSHVGEIWWDLSTTRYINYEQGSLEYRAKNWGRLAPGTTIDVYEWVRSPVSPTEWSIVVQASQNLSQYGVSYIATGTVRNADNPAWTETTEYDSSGIAKTWYYFWVGHSDMPPSVPTRTLTTNELSTIITNPNSNNLPWYAVISEQSLIVGNIHRYLHSDDTVMQMVYTTKLNNENDFKEWALVRNGDQYSIINEQFWSKLRDSLTGYDALGNQVPDPRLNELQRYGTLVRPRQSWFKDRLTALKIWVTKINDQLTSASTPLVLDPDKSNWTHYFNDVEPLPDSTDVWEYKVDDMSKLSFVAATIKDGERVLVLPTASNNNLWTIWTWKASLSEFVLTRKQAYNVSNYWQYIDWYYNGYDSDVIPTYIVKTTNDLSDINLTGKETVKVLDYGSKGWALFGLVDGEQRIVALQEGTIKINDNIWNSSLNLNGWDAISFDSVPFDYNPTIEIGIIFDGIKEGMYGSGSSLELNQLFFTMINYVLSEQRYVDWIFKTSFMVISGSYEPLSFSQLYKPNTSEVLVDFLNEAKPYRNKIREFISGRSAIDYARVGLIDFDRPPYEGRILDENNADDAQILINNAAYKGWEYFNKRTPSLIRQLKTTLVFDRVTNMPKSLKIVNAISFGSTVHFTLSDVNNRNRITPGEIITIANVISTGNTLVSFTSTDVIVSRTVGNVVIGTYNSNIGVGTGIGGTVFHQSFGAADRIMKLYQPTQYMPSAFSADLISGTDFKGQIYSGLNFNLVPGWEVSAWDFPAGWDADATAFDSYLEVILEGGMPPEYEQFYGNGSRKQFKLSKIPQDLEKTRIWCNGSVAVYGVDYIVPNWANKVQIIEPGSGYNVDEILRLVSNNPGVNDKSIEVKVTKVGLSGQIKEVIVVEKGFYKEVQHVPYRVVYASDIAGSGTDAYLQPVWCGDTLVFTHPPASSDKPNIWILYSGNTFQPAPAEEGDEITEGGEFVQPYAEEDHPEEAYISRIKDSVRLDTFTNPVGGRPVVVSRSYVTHPLVDHYDLGLRPQGKGGVFAYLDGKMLKQGPTGDYVVNFETGNLVFVLPPPDNAVLTTTTIGEGGAGNSVYEVYVVNGGSNYNVNDIITLDGGVPCELGDGSAHAAKVKVESISATEAVLVSAGNGYKKGDILILDNDTVESTDVVTRLTVKVDKVAKRNGAISEVSILTPGNYKEKPKNISWQSNGKGDGAVITPIWGVCTASLQDPGLYTKKPVEHFTQLSSTPVGGEGVIFSPRYTSIIDQEIFIASNNVQETFTLRTKPTNKRNMLISGRGFTVDEANIRIYDNNSNVTILSNVNISGEKTLQYGAVVVVTQFNTDDFSIATNTDITISKDAGGNLITSYSLLQHAGNTLPEYASVTVSINGKVQPPPLINTFPGNGYSRGFEIAYFVEGSEEYLYVYVDGVKQELGVDYQLIDKEVLLNNTLEEGSIMIAVFADPSYGYSYIIEDGTINFFSLQNFGYDMLVFEDAFGFDAQDTSNATIHEGDKVVVSTLTQDLSYKFVVEEFKGDPSCYYELASEPAAESTIVVIVNGVVQRMLWDYALEKRAYQGYDTGDYELQDYELSSSNEKSFVVFNTLANHTNQDVVIIRYMRGLTERLPTAFRQVIGPTGQTTSYVLDRHARTTLLSNVYTNSGEIEVENINVLTQPTLTTPGSIWIGNEKIDFYEVVPDSTARYPDRGFLTNLVRGVAGTNDSPITEYNTTFYDGDSKNKWFPTPSASSTIPETIIVDGVTQVRGSCLWFKLNGTTNVISLGNNAWLSTDSIRVYVLKLGVNGVEESLLGLNFGYYLQVEKQIRLKVTYPANTIIKVELDSYKNIRSSYYVTEIFDYYIEETLGVEQGRYFMFDNLHIPAAGYRNISITSFIYDSSDTTICHVTGSNVQDAGANMVIPGGYSWEPATNGLQYSDSDMAKFIYNHLGSKS